MVLVGHSGSLAPSTNLTTLHCCLSQLSRKPLQRASAALRAPLATMDVDYDEELPDEGKPTGRRMKGRGGEDDDRYAPGWKICEKCLEKIIF